MKAFITGGAGFIGSCMADRLLLGTHNSVTVFDNFSSGKREFLPADSQYPGRLQIHDGDLLELDDVVPVMLGHDIVFHFASNPDIARSAEDTSLDLKQSTVVTYNVLEAMRLTGVSQIVFLSGSGVYGDTAGEATAENYAPLLPVSMYGAGKLSAEALISAFAHMFDMKSYIFRPANIVGARQTHGVAFDFIQRLKGNPNELKILGDGKQSKSYIHVEDVLDAIFFILAMSDKRVNIFNVSTTDAVDVDWIAQAVLSRMGLTNTQLSYTGGDKGWPGDVPIMRMDTSKITQLGWRPRLSSEEAVSVAIEQMVKRLIGK